MRLFSLRSTTLDPVPGVPAQPMPRCHDGIPWTCRGQAEAASPLDLPGSWMDVGSHRRRPLGTWGLGQARSLPCGPEPLPGRNPIRRVDGASCCRVAAEMQLSNRRWNPRTTWAIENSLLARRRIGQRYPVAWAICSWLRGIEPCSGSWVLASLGICRGGDRSGRTRTRLRGAWCHARYSGSISSPRPMSVEVETRDLVASILRCCQHKAPAQTVLAGSLGWASPWGPYDPDSLGFKPKLVNASVPSISTLMTLSFSAAIKSCVVISRGG